MPSEPLPWDRRDFRKLDRSASDSRAASRELRGGASHEWRDQHHHAPPPYHQQQQQQRWHSDFCGPRLLPNGQSKQGGWPMYSDDTGQGFVPLSSRCERSFEGENCQPFLSRGGGRYFRNNRGNRGSFTRKGPSWQSVAVPNSPRETIGEVNNLRSIENTQPCLNQSSRSSYASHTPLNSVILIDPPQTQPLVREKNDNTVDNMTGKGQQSEKENCLGPVEWKPAKWSRVGNLSSRSSCISHPIEVLAEVQPMNATIDQSPSVDASGVRTNGRAQSQETGSRKKPRLGWGEGLAKYEKKKVEGPEDGITKSEPALSAISTESPLSQSVNLHEKSPRAGSLFECASPATPSSVACGSSIGVFEEKSVKEANLDCDANVSCSRSIASRAPYGCSTINLQNFELDSIANLSSLINELLQPKDPYSAENGDMQRMSMNKLLVWKVDVLKALEMTETKIESLELELRSSIPKPGVCCSLPAGPRSLEGEQQSRHCEVLDTASGHDVWPDTLNVSSGEMIVNDAPVGLEVGQVFSKDEDIDSPGSATSKFVNVLPAIFPFEKAEFSDFAGNDNVDQSVDADKKYLRNVFSSRAIPACRDLVSISKVYCNVNNVCRSILTSNRDAATRALYKLNTLLPSQRPFDVSVESIVSSLPRNSSAVKERFIKRKKYLQFKEKALTLKYKVFQHFWNEGRQVSIKTLLGRIQKKFDPSRNVQKRCRSRISSYAGVCQAQAVPADEVINYVNNLLSKLAFKPYRNTLKMPALILDRQVKMSRFISNNGRVEDPCTVEKERSMINPWSAEETKIFIEKLAAFGKDFMKIASFIDHKTVANCIEFYYKNHKSKWFEEARKNAGFIKQRRSQTTTYLVSSGKRRTREINAASLDILGAVSEIAANMDNHVDNRQSCPSRSSFGASSSCRPPRVVVNDLSKGSDSLDMDSNDREMEAADVLAGICGSLSPEAMSSSITSSVYLSDGYQDSSFPRISTSIKRPLTPEVTKNDVDGECSDGSCSELDTTDWSDEEKSIFIRAVSSYGKDFVLVSQCVRTKSTNQCKVFFSKAWKCLGLDLVQPETQTTSDDIDGGGSDIENDCNMETSSGIRIDSSDCKMNGYTPPPGTEFNHDSDMADSGTKFKTSDGNNGLGPLDSTTNEVVENSSIQGGCEDDNTVTDFNHRTEGQNGTDVSFVSVLDPQTVVASNSGFEQRIKEEDDLDFPKVENRVLVKVPNNHCAIENRRPLLPEDSNTSSGIIGKRTEPLHSSTQTEKKYDNMKNADLGTYSAEKSGVSSLLKIGRLASVTSSTLSEALIKYEKTPNLNRLLPCEASGIDGRCSQNIVSVGDCHQHLPCYSLSNSAESSRILQGYPVSFQSVKGTKSDVSSACPNVSGRDKDLSLDRHTDFLLQKCKESKSRLQSSYSSAGENPPTNGGVKLFGKILSSSHQKSSNSMDEDHRTRLESLNMKLSSDQKGSLDFSQSKFDCNKYAPSENTPVGRFGFWDGSRIQRGIPPIPDSALLLAKYPSAFSTFSLPSLHGTVNNRQELSSSSSSNRPRSQELQQDDMLAEMQRRSTFNASGINIGGRGGMVFGGEYCSSLTDPVAAIKMLYNMTEQLRMKKGGNAVSEEENRWISRDVGR